jgi:hypothetical protein
MMLSIENRVEDVVTLISILILLSGISGAIINQLLFFI